MYRIYSALCTFKILRWISVGQFSVWHIFPQLNDTKNVAGESCSMHTQNVAGAALFTSRRMLTNKTQKTVLNFSV